MNNQQNVQRLTARALMAKNPEVWSQFTQEDVQTGQVLLRRRMLRIRAGAVLAAAAFAPFIALLAKPEEALGWGLLSLALGSLLAFCFGELVSMGEHIALQELKPLKCSPQLCEQALKCLATPDALAYRDKVLANGRELLVGDFQCMKQLAAQRSCRELHGLPAA